MSLTVKAVRIEHHGGPEVLQFQQIELAAPHAHEVTVRHKAIGLNFIDIYFRSGLYSNALPHGLGFEAAGVVEAVGSEVRHVKVGDRVAYGQAPLGAYAQAHNVPADRVVPLPDQISYEQAAALMLKGLTCWYLLRKVHEVQAGQTILFHAAAGGVGLYACQWARTLGARLIGTASSAEKVALAKRLGAWEVIDYSREDVVERVKELTQGEKVSVVYDGVGKDTWEQSLDCLQARGLLVSFGNASGPVTGVNLGILAQKGSLYVTRPMLAAYVPTLADMLAASKELFGLVLNGDIEVQIGQRFAWEDVAQAHAELAARRTTGSTVLTLD